MNNFIDIPGCKPELHDYGEKTSPLKSFGRVIKLFSKEVAGELNYITCTGYDIDLWEREPKFHVDSEGNAYWTCSNITDAHIWVRMQDNFKLKIQEFYHIEADLEETEAYRVCKEYIGE